jgi:hypothetical protein
VTVFDDLDERFRPLAHAGAVLFSALAILMGLVAHGWEWSLLGLLIGVPGLVLPFVARKLLWSAGRMWLLLIFILVLELGVMSAIASTPGT